ncbi:MAG: hypothetical protein A3C58_01665 [Candidatus Staskawiczbacteria bacterium RIFCSPHIGHO2_02_FULL_34_10]|uniref:Uncharacterized protein n=2 Tax=Candidatus Staskawicziibacteriota TaxID=1817916 RepID=A0A1G2HMX0_9BACT|nr:MAG: hypothetical protein A2639_02195 [Candidatus Staskawiczbacteria bacterium RIFCSPHIGHO2_01_FULL_34_27]OGZ66235.1 MAG: hypothetical protein A3C58_01665 [Candidatus Staskawiczbacteria bacterium RIFCSPHIGHO2_02_FULL_34_10]
MDTLQENVLWDFSDLMNSFGDERNSKGEKILLYLFPAQQRIELEKRGIHCIVAQNYSKKNHEFIFSFVSRGKIDQISCQIGKKLIFSNKKIIGELMSLEQLSRIIISKIREFM